MLLPRIRTERQSARFKKLSDIFDAPRVSMFPICFLLTAIRLKRYIISSQK